MRMRFFLAQEKYAHVIAGILLLSFATSAFSFSGSFSSGQQSVQTEINHLVAPSPNHVKGESPGDLVDALCGKVLLFQNQFIAAFVKIIQISSFERNPFYALTTIHAP